MRKSLQIISQQTTVHGLHIAGVAKLHLLERLFWLGIIVVAAIGSIGIGYSNWTRYQANPTVVSIQKDFRNWENPFPAVTGCIMAKTDVSKAEKYIFNKWGIDSTHASYDYYMKFIKTVANVSYSNLADFKPFLNDKTLNNVDMFDIAKSVYPHLSGTLVTFDPKKQTNWKLVMTEMGICFSVNSKFGHLFSFSSNNVTNFTVEAESNILRCHYLNGLCYARYDSDPQLPLKYYVHSYLDVVHATIDPPLVIHESEELEINYRMQETESSTALRDLSPAQRKCRFNDEPISTDLPVYSISICYTICRYNLAMKLCGCRPFFYHIFGGNICDVAGLVCLSRFAGNFTVAPSQLGCNCPQPCDLLTYFAQVPMYTQWEYGYFDQRITFRWGLLSPTTKYHRDILFGFGDLVVSFGGALSLFLGVSFISMIETAFLLLEDIFNRFNNQKQPRLINVKMKPISIKDNHIRLTKPLDNLN